ncbi:MAG TPA: hypothetical protein VGD91_13885 [Trebonia sp.]
MDKDALKRQLTERFEQSLEAALAAVDAAPDGQWIAASEWEVRDIFQRLTADCFGRLVQSRIDRLPPATQAAFPPGGRPGGRPGAGGGGGRAGQGQPPGAGVDGRRGD